MFTIELGKKGFETLKYKGKYIHSKYNPEKEARDFIEGKKELLERDIVIIYGIGLGYHIEEIVKRGYSGEIIVFEYSKNLINLVEGRINWQANIKIIEFEEESFFSKMAYYLSQTNDIIIHKPSLEILKDLNINLYNALKNFEVERHSIEKQKVELYENQVYNLKYKYKGIGEFLHLIDKEKPCLIVAAGPSLDFEIEFIKKNKKKFNIICVGSAFKTLINNDIEPNGIVIIDAKPWVEKQLNFYGKDYIPLCFLSTASRWAINSHKGEKYIFFNEENDSEIVINTGKTVAVAATDIAIKAKVENIIFVGQDLAYLDNRTHTNTFESIYGYKDVIYKRNDYREVRSVDGKMLQTTEGFLYFKKQLEYLIKTNKNIKFYNISKGAYIQGAKNLTSKELIEEINF